ncbi:MAG: precorrin-6y C5,15-methyltransferase (decarboxylating) subunit CbiE [Cyanobacteria bacterium J06638_28]
MTPIHIIGIGLEGAAGLPATLQQLIEQATVLAGSDRHLSYFPDHPATRWPLSGVETQLQQHLQQPNPSLVVVLTSGDPLFFGLGRQLLQSLPVEALTFHPHISSIQLAFSRVKLPWQNAALVSAHGRSLNRLEKCLKAGHELIAVLTDTVHTPAAIAQFIQDLALPNAYRLWVCEHLGGTDETIQVFSTESIQGLTFMPLNVVILQRQETPPVLENLPLFGIPDALFLSFRDRPGLMTKREIRVQILAELALHPGAVVWDIGAGTGSVSVEIARLIPDGQVWAIEQTTAGQQLIEQNIERFATSNVQVIHGKAPQALVDLPRPHRIFIGGSQGLLSDICATCIPKLLPGGYIVAAIATLENLAEITQWLSQKPEWQGHYQQLSFSRSVAVGALTRLTPLNPVTLVRLSPSHTDF